MAKENGRFEFILFERGFKKVRGKKKMIFKKIPLKKFNPRRFYKLFVRHKPTGQKRLLAIGNFTNLPIMSQEEQRKGFFLGGRKFKPLKIPKKGKGNWITRRQIISQFDKELKGKARELKTKSAALLIPTKRFFHKKWLIFSDKFLRGNQKTKSVFAHIIVKFEYPRRQWLNKQFVPIEFAKPIMLKNLTKHIGRIEDLLNLQLEFLHPSADNVFVVKINGFIPM